MENQIQEPSPNPNRKDSNKIYFLVVVILALVGTNVYLFFKDKKANERIVSNERAFTDVKSSMQTDIDKIEAELDKANSSNVKLSDQMQGEQELARKKIADLRVALEKGQLTQGELTKAQESIKQLRYFVTKYASDIEELKQQNATLTTERNSLKTAVDSVSAKATAYEAQNAELNTKVRAAAALKTGAISVIPLRIRNSGKETDVTRASTAKKIRVNFTVAANAIAEKGLHDIYLRIIDPNGNFIMSPNGGMFLSENDEMQYTYRTAIEYANDGKQYMIDWTNPSAFEKGTYTVILYADGYTMGRSTLTLK